MCLLKEKPQHAAKPKTPRSPWRRFRQQIKPKLSRRVAPGARINLNDFWSKFEQLANNQAPMMTFDVILDNEINDNLLNERMELGN